MATTLEDMQITGIRNRERYLLSTDWLAIREAERGIIMETADSDKRQLAREEVSEIRDAVNYSEISHLTLTF